MQIIFDLLVLNDFMFNLTINSREQWSNCKGEKCPTKQFFTPYMGDEFHIWRDKLFPLLRGWIFTVLL